MIHPKKEKHVVAGKTIRNADPDYPTVKTQCQKVEYCQLEICSDVLPIAPAQDATVRTGDEGNCHVGHEQHDQEGLPMRRNQKAQVAKLQPICQRKRASQGKQVDSCKVEMLQPACLLRCPHSLHPP